MMWVLQLVETAKPYVPLAVGVGGSLIMVGVFGGKIFGR